MTEDLRRRLAETAAGARNSIAGDGGAESWLDKLCRAEGVADWPEQRLRDTSEMLDVLSETGRQARAVATGIQPVGGSGFAAAVTHRLPLNRKERYYTGTVLPMIVAGDGFMHLHRLLALCGLDHVQVQDDGATPLQGQQDIQFFTEYSFAESVFRPEDKQRFADRPLEADTPDLVISGRDWLLAIEAKMYHRPSTLDIETQMGRQRVLVDHWCEKFHIGQERARHIALLPAQFAADRRDLSVRVVTWEEVRDRYASVAPAYWLGVLRVALERYDVLRSPDATAHVNNDAWMRGDAILSQNQDGTLEYSWMGRAGGLDGHLLRGDLQSGGWPERLYEVRREALLHPHKNWFEISRFVAKVDKLTDRRDDDGGGGLRSDKSRPGMPQPVSRTAAGLLQHARPPGPTGVAMTLTSAQVDRAAGVLLTQACGDALGVPYEFRTLPPAGEPAVMAGGGLGPYAPGEYSDDTQMAVCIAGTAARSGADLTDDASLDDVAQAFLDWQHDGASDIGTQTASVLSAARSGSGRPAGRLRDAAAQYAQRHPHSAGNGALMRTAVVALPHLGDPAAIAAAARSVAELTHADPLAGDSCVLWCSGIDTAVREGSFDGVRHGLDQLPAARRSAWAGWLDDAEQHPPQHFAHNGYTVTALQAAWSAIVRSPVPEFDPAAGRFPCLHLQAALQAAVRAGHDTDTVAAIAGGLLGARWGGSAVPFAWRRQVHGWPDKRARDLVGLAVLAARRGHPDGQGWPTGAHVGYATPPRPGVPHPHDPDVVLGTAATIGAHTDAVVSLCRMGRADVPAPGAAAADHLEPWIIDSTDPAANPNLHFAVDDAARAVAALRDEGRRVLLHCVWAESRTPTVAARYAVLRGATLAEAKDDILAAMPASSPKEALWSALADLGDTS